MDVNFDLNKLVVRLLKDSIWNQAKINVYEKLIFGFLKENLQKDVSRDSLHTEFLAEVNSVLLLYSEFDAAFRDELKDDLPSGVDLL